MADDFLVQVKEVEQKAADMIEKALKKKQDDFVKYKQELVKKKELELHEAQEKMRQEMQKSKVAARKDYEEKVAEGEKEAKKFESEKINMLEGLMGEAEKLFLSII
jgi:hypothetical protein